MLSASSVASRIQDRHHLPQSSVSMSWRHCLLYLLATVMESLELLSFICSHFWRRNFYFFNFQIDLKSQKISLVMLSFRTLMQTYRTKTCIQNHSKWLSLGFQQVWLFWDPPLSTNSYFETSLSVCQHSELVTLSSYF